MLRSLRLILVLAALAVGGGLAFVAAASQAAIPSPLAAKAAAPTASEAGASVDSGGAADAGKNVGDLISSWNAALLLPIAGIMGFAAYGRGGIGAALVVAAITLIVGGPVFAPDEVKALIDSIWHTLRPD